MMKKIAAALTALALTGMAGSARTEWVVLPVAVSSEVNEARQHRARIKRLCAKRVAPTVAT